MMPFLSPLRLAAATMRTAVFNTATTRLLRPLSINVGLLNVDRFYDPLLSFIDLAVSEGFITEEARQIIISAPTVKELVMKLEQVTGAGAQFEIAIDGAPG